MKFISSAVLFFVVLGMWAGLSRANQIEEVIVFGDSLSDTGNVFAATSADPDLPLFPPSPPYGGIPGLHPVQSPGRFSDGPVWVEHLADILRLLNPSVERPAPRLLGGTNYAWGGAVTGFISATYHPTIDPQTQVTAGQPIGTQIESYLADISAGRVQPPDAGTLFIVWGGANDLILTNERAPAKSVKRLKTGIEQLIAAGASQIVVPNMPSIENTPGVGAGTPSMFVATGLASNLDRKVDQFNNRLDKTLDRIKTDHPGVTIFEPDVFALLEEVIENPSIFGFTNTATAAINEHELFINQQIVLNDNPFTSLFWDGVHPTTAAHRVLARRIFEVLGQPIPGGLTSNSVIPEPTTMSILGLGLLAWPRRRHLSMRQIHDV